jgi:hypothetical protein
MHVSVHVCVRTREIEQIFVEPTLNGAHGTPIATLLQRREVGYSSISPANLVPL